MQAQVLISNSNTDNSNELWLELTAYENRESFIKDVKQKSAKSNADNEISVEYYDCDYEEEFLRDAGLIDEDWLPTDDFFQILKIEETDQEKYLNFILLEGVQENIDNTIIKANDSYFGHFSSRDQFVDAVIESTDPQLSDYIKGVIDYEKLFSQLMSDYKVMNGYYFRK